MTIENMALTISIISLIISFWTFWLTRIRKGSLKMTRPSIICFLGQNGKDEPKIFIRTLFMRLQTKDNTFKICSSKFAELRQLKISMFGAMVTTG
jgi:hypothetical protein